MLASFGVTTAVGAALVLAALGTPKPDVEPVSASAADTGLTPRSVAYGHARVVVRKSATGRLCFQVRRGASTVARSCASTLPADQIAYASSSAAVGGIAGTRVRAVILKLTRKGTVWATLRRGTFYAAVPAQHELRAVVKVLAGGSRRSFAVTGSR